MEEIKSKFNKKMELILDKKDKNIKLNIYNLKDLFFPNFKKVYDCIIISLENTDKLEKTFQSSVQFLGGKNFYEISETEILINSYLKMDTKKYSLHTLLKFTLIVVRIWKIQLKELDSEAKFCFIISVDKSNVTLRYHKVRLDETEWLVDDLDSYEEPIGYIIY